MFSIGEMTKAAGAAAPAGSVPVAVLIWLARVGIYLGLFVGVGGAFFAAWIGQGADGAKAIIAALRIGCVSAVVSLGLQGIDLLNLPFADIVTPAPWTGALATSLGPSLLIAIAAMVFAYFALWSPSVAVSWGLTSAAMLGVGLSLVTTGHAATAPPSWLTRPSLFLHGIGIAYWAGALAPLAAMAWRRSESLPRVLKDFSTFAVPVVGVLVLTGLGLAVIQLESVGALIGTGYGLILLVKLTLVVLLLALAALNRFHLTATVVADHRNTRPLLRSVVCECVLVVGILAVVAGWRFTPPPRTLVAELTAPLVVHIHTDAAMFEVLVSPGKVGGNGFVLQLMNGDASPLQAKEVTLVLSLPERGIEPLERTANLGADGDWHVEGVPLPYPGRWHMRLEALVTDFKKVTLEDELDIPPH